MNATEDPERKLAAPVHAPYVKVLDLEQTLSDLTAMVDQLQSERDDLEIALTTAIEHGDAIESQLATANVQLQKEVLERRNVEKQLRLLVATITEKSRDLELVLQTITEHADQIDMEWLKRYIESESAARHDSLTGLANRRMLDEAIASEWARGRRESRPVAMLMCDVDHFKEYNDLHGHRAGDECLRRIADVLGGALHRKGDLAARYGGEEFIVLLPNTDREGARAIAANIQRALAHEAIEHGNSPLGAHITLSIGVSAMVPENGDEGPLFAEVDRLLYRAKQQGRNRIVA
ncbi:diguanylate cyclase [Pseudazoarcus pumilus]|uniref:diguanylate cyclase n=1 Tax=Pseudazoarcus pumilus TaxID=2067960 RepID=A0A2I6S9L8_9RHOO|nr:diguanylate cyclase [Pseudazoarcus pumilus]AUN95953.1 GGDEF domain-containing protein [Pseudazoarcus pumilus]